MNNKKVEVEIDFDVDIFKWLKEMSEKNNISFDEQVELACKIFLEAMEDEQHRAEFLEYIRN